MRKQGLTFPHLHIHSRAQRCAIISMLLPHLVCSNQKNVKRAGGGGDLQMHTFIAVKCWWATSPAESFSICCNFTSGKQSIITTNPKIQQHAVCLFLWCFMTMLWHFHSDMLCWHIQGGQSSIAFIESHLSSPSCIIVCGRMNWIKIESGAERRRGCVCSPNLTACHFLQERAITPTCLAVFRAERYTL